MRRGLESRGERVLPEGLTVGRMCPLKTPCLTLSLIWRRKPGEKDTVSFSARDATPEKGDHGGDVSTAGHRSLGLGTHTPPWVRKNFGILTPTLSRVTGQAVRKQSLPPFLTPLESVGRCPEEQAEQDPQPVVPAGNKYGASRLRLDQK